MVLTRQHGDGEDRIIFVGADPSSVEADLQGEVLLVTILAIVLNEVDDGFAHLRERRGKRSAALLARSVSVRMKTAAEAKATGRLSCDFSNRALGSFNSLIVYPGERRLAGNSSISLHCAESNYLKRPTPASHLMEGSGAGRDHRTQGWNRRITGAKLWGSGPS